MNLKQILETVSRNTGAIANIHVVDPRVLDIDALRISPHQHYHHGTYCQFRKLSGKHPGCASNKERSIAIARLGRTFWGTCPFGVWDLAKPVFFDQQLVAVVYLGSLTDGTELSTPDKKTYIGPALREVDDHLRDRLKYYAQFIADYIQLACQHWVDDGNSWNAKRTGSYYADICMNFIETKYTQPVRLQDLADSLGLTSNHLGEQIKRHFGLSFRKLLEDHRIQKAKISLLSEVNKPITRIAYECGFSESNYFSTVFKKAIGLSPRAYRKNVLSDD